MSETFQSRSQELENDYIGKVYNISNEHLLRNHEYLESAMRVRMRRADQTIIREDYEENVIFKNLSIIASNIKILLEVGKSFVVVGTNGTHRHKRLVKAT